MTSMMSLAVEAGEVQDLREQLRDAHLCRAATEAKLANCQKALARGEGLVASAQAAIQQHDEAARLVAEAEADRIVAEAQGLRVTLPDDSAGDRAGSRHVAEQRLADATRARSILQAEVELAKRDHAAASRNVDNVAAALAAECGERLATEMLAAERVAHDLRMMLTGLAGQWTAQDGKPARIKLGPRAVRALAALPLNDDRSPRPGPAHLSPVAPHAAAWRQTLERLKADPDADLPGIMGD